MQLIVGENSIAAGVSLMLFVFTVLFWIAGCSRKAKEAKKPPQKMIPNASPVLMVPNIQSPLQAKPPKKKGEMERSVQVSLNLKACGDTETHDIDRPKKLKSAQKVPTPNKKAGEQEKGAEVMKTNESQSKKPVIKLKVQSQKTKKDSQSQRTNKESTRKTSREKDKKGNKHDSQEIFDQTQQDCTKDDTKNETKDETKGTSRK
ncbi:hypothetical protein M3Y96_00046600 [Aphelenchoides besseyi]|nr:hypothetical protein M3Y96_00046600 [Aphelenchoides besseyi]